MSKAQREQSARDRIRSQREAEKKQEQRKRVATYVTVGVVALAAIGAGWLFAANQSKPEETGQALAPVTIQGDGSVAMGNAGVTAPVIDIYEDFQCPACKQLEETSGATFKNLAAEGKAKVVYHPLTIFPQQMNKGITRANSARAGAAARCVTDGKQWMAFHDKLFEKQPEEHVEGFTTDQLVALGQEAGVTAPDFATCVTSQKFAQAHAAYSEKTMTAINLTGTPTVKLNGKDMDQNVVFTPSELRKTVLDAAK
ncbi:DsbA family protein [Nonomuraea africana]|uniref:Protein-disulfide isomerase n=1 Tax=Nonomuraea africana TaxID=46171 RepID=A0ABR9KH94_9ACTN|nr:thioredoxin domain-containing protein [Nonomuraea africana]MBE1561355.1 protein-disulfide isomerase [Nonomuraea africana]